MILPLALELGMMESDSALVPQRRGRASSLIARRGRCGRFGEDGLQEADATDLNPLKHSPENGECWSRSVVIARTAQMDYPAGSPIEELPDIGRVPSIRPIASAGENAAIDSLTHACRCLAASTRLRVRAYGRETHLPGASAHRALAARGAGRSRATTRLTDREW